MVWQAFAGAVLGSAVDRADTARQNKLNRQEAQRARDFSASESAKARDFNSAQALLQRDWSADQAAINRKFQLDNSNTAVRRRMSDLKSAGINPILAGQYAADSPAGGMLSGSAASTSPGGTSTASTVGQKASALQNMRASMELKTMGAQINQIKALTKRTTAEAEVKEKEVPTSQAIERIKSDVINKVDDFTKHHSAQSIKSDLTEFKRGLKAYMGDLQNWFGSQKKSMYDDKLNTVKREWQELKARENKRRGN